jgi:hypothetical protein
MRPGHHADVPRTLEVIPKSWKVIPARPREVQLPGLREDRFLGDRRPFDRLFTRLAGQNASSSPNVSSGDDQAITWRFARRRPTPEIISSPKRPLPAPWDALAHRLPRLIDHSADKRAPLHRAGGNALVPGQVPVGIPVVRSTLCPGGGYQSEQGCRKK